MYRTHVCTDSLVARVTIGRKGAPFRMSHVYTCVQFGGLLVHMCTRRTPRSLEGAIQDESCVPYTCVQGYFGY